MSAPLVDKDGEVRELNEADFKRMKPLRERNPNIPKRVRGPQKAPTKVPVSIRLNPEVVEYFKATGTGWQSRIGTVLQDYIASHSVK